ncbi:MAG: DUF4118 domain-containing protein, partial [Oscillospiraceae bacterium]
SLRDSLITIGILLSATELCILLRLVEDSTDGFASLIFVLAVLLVSRLTTGYFYGLAASLLGVIGVNFIFTYPYLAFNFTISGYPVTFFTMLVVSLITCALTTQIKQQERLRAESEKEKMRANLLRSVSHDIRTPLTSIVGATSAVLDNEATLTAAQKRGLLEDVKEDAQWLIRVVENLLSITRISDTAAEITKETEAAEEILAESVRKFRKRYPAYAVTVEVPDELVLVPMDAILIEQVLGNLLENAARHGETATEIRLSVKLEGRYAAFFVRDNGVGIPDKILPTLFDGSMKQGEIKRSDGKRNMGIGLAVCLAIVHAHGGTMTAQNLPKGGAEFSFRLPLFEEETP